MFFGLLNRIFSVVAVLVLAAVLGQGSPIGTARAETCEKCSYKECIQNMIEQKQKMKDGYNQLAEKWKKFWTDTNSDQRVPMRSVDIGKLKQEYRLDALATLNKEHTAFQKDEEQMQSKVGSPEGCGFPPDAEVYMVTNSIACTIDIPQLEKAEKQMPCAELYQIAFRHEIEHKTRCDQRKGAVVLTTYGKALEEAQAYSQEIQELNKLLKKAEKKCKNELARYPTEEDRMAQKQTFKDSADRVTDYINSTKCSVEC